MYNHAPEPYRCPFCLLIQGTENPHTLARHTDIVHHNAMVTAFVGVQQWPNNHGKVLVVPNDLSRTSTICLCTLPHPYTNWSEPLHWP